MWKDRNLLFRKHSVLNFKKMFLKFIYKYIIEKCGPSHTEAKIEKGLALRIWKGLLQINVNISKWII